MFIIGRPTIKVGTREPTIKVGTTEPTKMGERCSPYYAD